MEFQNEKKALQKLNRLISFDDESLVLVQVYIPGRTFNELLYDLNVSPEIKEDLIREYFDLPEKLHEKGIIHNDIVPLNVIVTPELELVPIDFGRSAELSSDRIERNQQIYRDIKTQLQSWRDYHKRSNQVLKEMIKFSDFATDLK